MTDTEPEDMTAPADVPGDETPATRRHWGRRLAKGAAITLASLVALLLAALWLLDTPPGRRFVAEQIQGLQFQNGLKIGIGRIEGSLYGKMTIHDLSLKDPEGEFLYSPQVELDWRPLHFVSNHLDIRSVLAKRMYLRRMPQLKPTTSNQPLLPSFDIDVGRLKIDHLVIEKPVTGARRFASLDAKAHIVQGRAQVELNGKTVAVDGGAKGDRIAIALDAVPEQNRLALDATVEAPEKGVIAAMTGLGVPLSLQISGKGDWKQWNGLLKADSGDKAMARLTLAARDGTFAIKGPTHLAPLVSGQLASLLGSTTQLDLGATLDNGKLALSGGLSNDALRLDSKGGVDLSNNAFDKLNLAFTLVRPSALNAQLHGSPVTGDLLLDGDFAKPRMEYHLSSARLAYGTTGVEQFRANGTGRFEKGTIRLPLTIRARRLTGLDTAAGGRLANVRIDGEVAIKGSRVLADNLRIHSDRIDAKAVLLADLGKGTYGGSLDATVDRYRLESVAILNLQGKADIKASQRGGLGVTGRIRARSTKLLNDSVGRVLGGNFVAAGDVRYNGGAVKVANLQLRSPDLNITGGHGSYFPDGRIALYADGSSDRYGKVGIRVAGTLTQPDAQILAERPGLGIGLANLDARLTGVQNGYGLAVKADTDYGPLTADVTIGTGAATTLRIDRADLSGVQFAGTLQQTPAGPFTGTLKANGNGLAGIVELGAQGKYQQATFNLRSTGTVFAGPAGLSIGSAIIDGKAVLYDQPLVVADVQLADTRYRQFDLNAARIKIDYRNGQGQAKGVIEMAGRNPLRLAVNAQLEPQMWKVTLDGKTRGVTFGTAGPARIRPGANGYELLPSTFKLGDGKLELAGNFGSDTKLFGKLDGVNLAQVNAFVPGLGIGGKASGTLDFVQPTPSAFPRANADLKIAGFTRTSAAAVSQPVDVHLAGKLLPDGGDLRAVIRARGGVIGRVQASLRPVAGGASWTQRLMAAPLSGGVRYNGPADTLISFSGQTDQRLVGPLAIAADFSCRVDDPCLNGIVRGTGLTYENRTYGTKLTDMVLNANFAGNKLNIEKLTANAGKGTVVGSGYVNLSASAGYPMDIEVKLDRAQLAHSDALSGAATGQLKLTKAAGETALLSGSLELPEARYAIVRQGAAQVPQLSGVHFLPPKGRTHITGNETPPPFSSVFDKIRLDISLSAPNQIYVSGMGLESEWGAKFTVFGTATDPRLRGNVSLQRGTLGFAGHSFKLTSGTVRFTGGKVIDPELNLTATDDIENVTVNVDVGGRSSDPRISFSSVPGLPQDEIMSRILFGSSIANLSPLQAVQLAGSLNSLRGSGGGLNPLGKLRSVAGIDRLRILGADQQTGRGTAVAVGQHITDDVYVELITDARGFTATQLEISLTPWLSVLSEAGGSGVSSLNVQIKKNY